MADGREYVFISIEGHQFKDDKLKDDTLTAFQSSPTAGERKRKIGVGKGSEDLKPPISFGPPSSDIAVNRRCQEEANKQFLQKELDHIYRLSEKQEKGFRGTYCYLDDDDEGVHPPTLINSVDKKSKYDAGAKVGAQHEQSPQQGFQSIEQMFDTIIQSVPVSASTTSANDMEQHISSMGDSNSHHLGAEDDDTKDGSDSQIMSYKDDTGEVMTPYRTPDGSKETEWSKTVPTPMERDSDDSVQYFSNNVSGPQNGDYNTTSQFIPTPSKVQLPYVLLNEESSILSDSIDKNRDVSELSQESERNSRFNDRSRKHGKLARAFSVSLERAQTAAMGLIQRVRARSLSPREAKSTVTQMIRRGKALLTRSKDTLNCLLTEDSVNESKRSPLEITSKDSNLLQNKMDFFENCLSEHHGHFFDQKFPRTTVCKASSSAPLNTVLPECSRTTVSTLVGFFEKMDQGSLSQLYDRSNIIKSRNSFKKTGYDVRFSGGGVCSSCDFNKKDSPCGDSSEDVSYLTSIGSNVYLGTEDIQEPLKRPAEPTTACEVQGIKKSSLSLKESLEERQDFQYENSYTRGHHFIQNRRSSAPCLKLNDELQGYPMSMEEQLGAEVEENAFREVSSAKLDLGCKTFQNVLQEDEDREFEIYSSPELRMISNLDHDCVSLCTNTDGYESVGTNEGGQRSPLRNSSYSESTENTKFSSSCPPPNSPKSNVSLDGKNVCTTISLFETRSALCHKGAPETDSEGSINKTVAGCSTEAHVVHANKNGEEYCSKSGRYPIKAIDGGEIFDEMSRGPVESESNEAFQVNGITHENGYSDNMNSESDIQRNAGFCNIFSQLPSSKQITPGEMKRDVHEEHRYYPDIQQPIENTKIEPYSSKVLLNNSEEYFPRQKCEVQINNMKYDTKVHMTGKDNISDRESPLGSKIDATENGEQYSDISENFMDERGSRKVPGFVVFSKIPEEPEVNESFDELPSPPSNSPGSSNDSVHIPLKRCAFYENLMNPNETTDVSSRIDEALKPGVDGDIGTSRLSKGDKESSRISLNKDRTPFSNTVEPRHTLGESLMTSDRERHISVDLDITLPLIRIEAYKEDEENIKEGHLKFKCDASLAVPDEENHVCFTPVQCDGERTAHTSLLNVTHRNGNTLEYQPVLRECSLKNNHYETGTDNITNSTSTEAKIFENIQKPNTPSTENGSSQCPGMMAHQLELTNLCHVSDSPTTARKCEDVNSRLVVYDLDKQFANANESTLPSHVDENQEELHDVGQDQTVALALVPAIACVNETSRTGNERSEQPPRCIRWDVGPDTTGSPPTSSSLSSEKDDSSVNRCNSCMPNEDRQRHNERGLAENSIPKKYSDKGELVEHKTTRCRKLSNPSHNYSKLISVNAENLHGEGKYYNVTEMPNAVVYNGMRNAELCGAIPLDEAAVTSIATTELTNSASSVGEKHARESSKSCKTTDGSDVQWQNRIGYQAGLAGLCKTGQLKNMLEIERVVSFTQHLCPVSSETINKVPLGGAIYIDINRAMEMPAFSSKTVSLEKIWKEKFGNEFSSTKDIHRSLSEASIPFNFLSVISCNTLDSIALGSYSARGEEKLERKDQRLLNESKMWPKNQMEPQSLREKLTTYTEKVIQTIDFVERAHRRIDQCNALIDKSLNTLRRSSEISQKCRLHLRTVNLLLRQKPRQRSLSDIK